MSDSWPTARLADLAVPAKGAIAGGPFGSDLVSADYVDEGVPVIRGVNLPFDRKIELDNLVFVSEAKADSLHLNCASPGDLVFTQRGTLGQVGLLPEHPRYSRYLISQSQMKMTVDPAKASALYLYHYFRLPSSVTYIENHALQSGVPHINLGILRKLEVILPPLPVQHRIAAVLDAYDDLIANNQRRIALLESMAEEIYREWFVRMRFPGAGRARFEKGLPVGWERKNLRGVAEVDPLERRRTGEPVPFVPMDRLSTQSMYFDADEMRSDWAGAKFRNHDVLLPRITPSLENGKRGYVLCLKDDEVGVGSTEFIVLRATQISPEHLYFLSISDGFRKHAELSMSGASGRQRVQDDCFNFFLVAVPPPVVTEAFVQVVRPMFKQVFKLAEQNKRLAAHRDALLPRLISGKLRVDALDIQFPPSMQQPPAEAAQRESIAH